MERLELQTTVRESTGNSPARSLRRSGHIPAILYGPKTDPVLLSVNVKELEQLTASVSTKAVHVFEINDVRYNSRWGEVMYASWYGTFKGNARVPVFAENGGIGKLNVYSEGGTLIYSDDINLDKGLNYLDYNLTIDAEKLSQFNKELKKAKKEEQEGLDVYEHGMDAYPDFRMNQH